MKKTVRIKGNTMISGLPAEWLEKCGFVMEAERLPNGNIVLRPTQTAEIAFTCTNKVGTKIDTVKYETYKIIDGRKFRRALEKISHISIKLTICTDPDKFNSYWRGNPLKVILVKYGELKLMYGFATASEYDMSRAYLRSRALIEESTMKVGE